MIKEFTIGVSHTINLGHYESMKIEASVTMDVQNYDFDEDIEGRRERAQTELRQLLEQTYLKQKRKTNGQREQRESSSTD